MIHRLTNLLLVSRLQWGGQWSLDAASFSRRKVYSLVVFEALFDCLLIEVNNEFGRTQMRLQ